MVETDYCKYVDPFYGSGETDRIFTDGLASKWFYIKALCGNTTPHAALPFGRMSVGAYSGGYPTGYGRHYPNFCGGIKKLSEQMLVSGFTHLHQSGTGDIGFFYNYLLTTPFFGDKKNSRLYRPIRNESAKPGYYSAELEGIRCELTVNRGVALHRYTFPEDGGRVAIDFSNDGLNPIFGERYRAKIRDYRISIEKGGEITFSGVFSGIRLHFAVRAKNATRGAYLCLDSEKIEKFEYSGEIADRPIQAVFPVEGRECLIAVAFSTISPERALLQLSDGELDFDRSAQLAYGIWNEYLSKFRIETDSETDLEKFYSNLYHSLIKPCDMTGECVLGVEGEVVTDLATFWDQYKTLYPLIYFAYPEMAGKVVRCIENISRTLGRISCSFGLSDILPAEMQAKMLGVITLVDAYQMGVPEATVEGVESCALRELEREDYKSFLENGKFERYTHILDVCDALIAVAGVTKNTELRERLLALSESFRNAYAPDGLMSDDSPYYEGDRYTYSYRLSGNMEERIELIGGKDRFAESLDKFFGFGGESVRQFTHLNALEDIRKTAHHRFEGFNNECDMETPYAYIFADRHDRLEDILRECVSRSFGTGSGGLPGNNDSGGLSSLYVWNMLGLFPATGRGEFLIGAPGVRSAEISLASGRLLKIKRVGESVGYLKRVVFNGREIKDYRISMGEVMGGGELVFYY